MQGPIFAASLLLSILVFGTLGYIILEGWGVLDALYMTVITIATVGYGETHPLSTTGRVFTMLLILCGVGAAAYTFTLLATLVVEGGVSKRLQQWRDARMLDTIKDHFIVCGYGRIGSIIAHQFKHQKVPLVIIERDPDRMEEAMHNGLLAVEADASREDVLKRVGIARARAIVAAVGTDAENVYCIMSARVLRPDIFIVGRAETEDAKVKIMRAGANRVISPYQIGALQMAQTAIRPAVVDFVELATSASNLELAMEQVSVSQTSSLVNRTIRDIGLRERFGVIIVGIQHATGRIDFNPAPETAILAQDKLVVLGRPDSLKKLETEASK